jgi:ketol-acid reductoisomerase
MTTFYRESDAPPDALSGLSVAIAGYGNLGRSMALNLRDSGVTVRVGNQKDAYRELAESDGFTAHDIAAAVENADVVYVLLPDEVIPAAFAAEIAPHLRDGSAVCFASGYVLAFGLIEPPPQVDVLLLAPRMLGADVRRAYVDGTGYWSYVAVERDATGAAQSRLLGLAAAVGALRRGALELPASQEARLDLFVEQGFGSWLGTALQLAFDVGVQGGLPPEALVLELYKSGEMASTFRTFAEKGFLRSVLGHGYVATFGGFQGTLGVSRETMLAHFEKIFADIDSGRFASQLQEEQDGGYPTVSVIRSFLAGDNPMTEAEKRVEEATSAADGHGGR